MAYKPKYAAKGRGARPSSPRTGHPNQASTRASQSIPAVEPEKKKRSPLSLALLILAIVIVVPMSLFATAKLLTAVGMHVGHPKPVIHSRIRDLSIQTSFADYVQTRMGDIRLELGPTSSAGAVTGTPEETVPVETKPQIVREHYTIAADAKVAPEPNQNYFGEETDPATMQWLLDEAAWMLQEDPMYFGVDTEIYKNSKIMYYLDDSIFAVTWKEVHDNTVYTFSEVKLRDPSQFRCHLAGGEFGSDIQYFTTEMAETVNAVVASGGDFHRFRNFGICVYEGQVKKVEGTYAETCMIDKNGNMSFVYGGDITKSAEAQAYVDEHEINFSLCFGPVLVDDYKPMDHSWYGVGEINDGYARAALCQMADLHYLVVTANVQPGEHEDLPTVADFQRNIVATGCRMAYCLDGGQTASIVMNDELINRPAFGTQRKISDIIYFATAVPEGG